MSFEESQLSFHTKFKCILITMEGFKCKTIGTTEE